MLVFLSGDPTDMLQELEGKRAELMREVHAVSAAIKAYAETIGQHHASAVKNGSAPIPTISPRTPPAAAPPTAPVIVLPGVPIDSPVSTPSATPRLSGSNTEISAKGKPDMSNALGASSTPPRIG